MGLGGGGSQEKSLLDLGLCTCLCLCGADSENLSGTRLLCLRGTAWPSRMCKYWVMSENLSSLAVEGGCELTCSRKC